MAHSNVIYEKEFPRPTIEEDKPTYKESNEIATALNRIHQNDTKEHWKGK